MVIKVYTSGISGNKEVKKRQQRIMMILDSKNIAYQAIDITEPGKESEKQFMQDNAKAKDAKHPLPPQLFNEDDYCGDYDGFDLSNENDELEVFLKLPLPPTPVIEPPPVVNGRAEHSNEKDTDGITADERNEEFINNMIPNSVDTEKTDEEPPTPPPVEEPVEETVHGFCYTPSLAKRLEKAMKSRIKKIQPSVHGFCYTPSLASRLTKAIEQAFLRKKTEDHKKEDIKNEDDAMDEDKEEAEPAVNNEEEMDDQNEEENGGTEEEEDE